MIIRISLSNKCIDSVLAKDIYKDENLKLMVKNTVLTEAKVSMLKKHGVRSVYIIKRDI